jgi:hypothetical protein
LENKESRPIVVSITSKPGVRAFMNIANYK